MAAPSGILGTLTTAAAGIGGAASILVAYLRWGREDVGKAAETAASLVTTMRGVNDEMEDAMKRLVVERDELRHQLAIAERELRKRREQAAENAMRIEELELEIAHVRSLLLRAEGRIAGQDGSG